MGRFFFSVLFENTGVFYLCFVETHSMRLYLVGQIHGSALTDYLMMISSAKIHDFPPAPLWYSGHVPLFFAMTFRYWAWVFVGRVKSLRCVPFSLGLMSFWMLPISLKFLPSLEV